MLFNQKIKPIKRLWHDSSAPFLSTIEPAAGEDVTVLLRAEKQNVTKAFVEFSLNGTDFTPCEMKLSHTDKTGTFEYFQGIIPGQNTMFKYRFRVGNDDPQNEVYYCRAGVSKTPPCFNEKCLDSDNLWCLVPDFHTPDWAKGTIWYSIMPDAFYNGDLTNDEPFSGSNYPNSWNNVQNTLQYKYGGDLKGIEKKLQYIKDLGCEAIFMDPIFKSTQNAGYGPEFYKQIENSFGNAKALEELAAAVHKNGMHYMIDIVLAFVAMNDIWFNGYNNNPHPGARQKENSPYHDYFFFDGEKGDLSKFRSSWGGASLNHASEDFCNKIYKDPNSYLQYYISAPFNVDAIRYDCGGDLYGVYPDGTQIRDWQIVEKMRPILRKINPEIMLLSEYSMYYSVDRGVWDSRWNLEFAKYATKFMNGEFPESAVEERINHEMLNLPRNFALCQYTSISDHDRPRTHGVTKWAFEAYQLIQMTTVCAPCIYYGDEVKIEREHGSFYAMEWDESAWNYEILNRTKALTSLRKTISAVKSGSYKHLFVDDDRHLFAFARKDEESTVITISSRNPYNEKVIIDTVDLEEPDGTIFTDWLTGAEYVSKNGKIEVNLIPGGSVIVKGTQSFRDKGGFAVADIGGANAEIISENINSITLSGKGQISNNDIISFAHTHLFGNCRISARLNPKGSGVIMLRADISETSPFVAVKSDGHNLSVIIRKASGEKAHRVAFIPVSKGDIIEISRDDKNSFTVTVGQIGGDNSDIISDNLRADMPNHILGGFAVIKGSCKFDSIVTDYNKNPIACDDFSLRYTAMLDRPTDADLKYNKVGLLVNATSSNAELLTNAYCEDWSFKTSFKPTHLCEDSYCGISCVQDEDNAVIAGRTVINENAVFFIGRCTGGGMTIHHTLPDTLPTRYATIQLQRIGTAYSAVASYNDKSYRLIGAPIIANLCAERVGLCVSSDYSAVFKYASFGDVINGGHSYNTPITTGKHKADFERMNDICAQPRYRIVSGDWKYATEGYLQAEDTVGQMGIENKRFKGFKADGTYLFDKEGFVCIEVGKLGYTSPMGDGIVIKIESNGYISIIKNGDIIADAKSDKLDDTGLRICAEYLNETLVLYHGQNGEPLLTLRNFDIPEGYITYFASQGAHINNSLLASTNTPLYYAAEYETPIFDKNSVRKCWQHSTGFINQFGLAFTDFIATAKFKAIFSPSSPEGFAGLYICSPEGKFYTDKGLRVVYNQHDRLQLRNGDSILKDTALGTIPTDELSLKVVKKNGEISIFVNNTETPQLIFKTDFGGGAVSLCAYKASATFSEFTVTDITGK